MERKYSDLDRLINSIAKRASTPAEAAVCANTAWLAASDAGLTICDLKPLAETLGCEPEMGVIRERVAACLARIDEVVGESNKHYEGLRSIAKHLGCKNDVWAIKQVITALKDTLEESEKAPRIFAAITRALNWERTEFSTLGELLAEIRGEVEQHSKFVDAAIEQNELMDEVREKLSVLGKAVQGIPLLNEAIALLEPRKCVKVKMAEQTRRQNAELREVTKDMLDKIMRLGRAPAPAEPGIFAMTWARSLQPTTHTILHASELYRDATLLLQTAQLIAWRTDDGQEFSAAAHSVTLDPDADGLAAEILSRITGYELAPEHMAELRAQMGGVV